MAECINAASGSSPAGGRRVVRGNRETAHQANLVARLMTKVGCNQLLVEILL